MAEQKPLAAVQAALAAEHAAVYGYGVVGARVSAAREAEARAAYDAHRARRDALRRTVTDLGGTPVAAVYADLVRAATSDLRRDAAGWLREAAVRAVRWRGESVAFPGLAERAADPASASPSA